MDDFCANSHQLRNAWACHFTFKELQKEDEFKDLLFYAPAEECKEVFIYVNIMNFYTNVNVVACYGMHQPIRSSLELDDYHDVFYIGSGFHPDYVLIYKRRKYPSHDLVTIVKHVNIGLVQINACVERHHSYTPPSNPQKNITYNENQYELEIIYLRKKLLSIPPDNE